MADESSERGEPRPENAPEQSAMPELPARVRFDYIKSSSYRVVHADGVWGGVTPRGWIQMNFFSERHAIPKSLIHELTPEGKLGPEVDRVTRDSVVREVETGVVLSLETARSLEKWLRDKIEALESIRRESQEGQEADG